MLVAIGAALFTLVSAYAFRDFITSSGAVRTDPTRIAAQIVTGIGFLGAGAIIREGLSVRGLTTAASLWIVAAAGMAAGAGYYWAAVVATALTIFALWPLRLIAYRTIERLRPEENRLVVELQEGQPIAPLLAELTDVRHFEVDEERDRRVVTLELPHIDEDLVAKLSDLDYVIGIRWRR
jgi:putative Mg2+ transporter-C (MgtC) family protein